MFFIYSIIYSIAVIFLLPFEYFRRPQEIRKRWLREKFGLWDNPPFPPFTKGGWGDLEKGGKGGLSGFMPYRSEKLWLQHRY